MKKGAIIGFGAVAQNAHTPAFEKRKKHFEIIAIADTNKNSLEKAKKLFPKARLYKTDTELFAKEKNLHFADIALPPALHYEIILKAFKKNLNVLCEKPLVLKISELDNITRISKSKKLCLFTVHNWKYAPPIIKAKEIINKGILGKIKNIEIYVLRTKPSVSADKNNWRSNPKLSGGGIFTDHGWHNLYLACHLTENKKPHSIAAQFSYPARKKAAENEAQVYAKFGKTNLYMYLTWKSPKRSNQIFISGSKANMSILDDIIVVKYKNNSFRIYKTKEKLSLGSAHPTWMEGCLDEFLLELQDKKKRGSNLAEAAICLNLLQVGYKSAKTGKVVEF